MTSRQRKGGREGAAGGRSDDVSGGMHQPHLDMFPMGKFLAVRARGRRGKWRGRGIGGGGWKGGKNRPPIAGKRYRCRSHAVAVRYNLASPGVKVGSGV